MKETTIRYGEVIAEWEHPHPLSKKHTVRFDVDCVRDFLKNFGAVYTVRSYCVPEPTTVIVDGIGKCVRTLIGEVKTGRDLLEAAPLSGFGSLKEWVVIIRSLYRGKRKYLYLVETAD